MSRVSQEELYNDKDVVTQILKLKDTVNDYAGGIIENIDVSGNDLVIDWADGESIALPLPSPTGISSIAGSISGTNLTITIYMTDGSSHAFTTPLNGIATESYVDNGLASKVDAADVYTSAEIDTMLGDYATTTYVDGKKVTTQLTNATAFSIVDTLDVGDELFGERIDTSDSNHALLSMNMKVTSRTTSSVTFRGCFMYLINGAVYPGISLIEFKLNTSELNFYYFTGVGTEANIVTTTTAFWNTYVVKYS